MVVDTFADAGIFEPVSSYSVEINWATARRSPAGPSPGADGFVVSGQHTFTRPGTFAGSVTVHASDGATLSIPFTATSTRDARVQCARGHRGTVPQQCLAPATLSPVGGTNFVPSSYTASIDFGDGTPIVPGYIDASGRVLGSHTFEESGTYIVRVVIGIPDNPNILTGTAALVVADRPIVLVGPLDPADDTGLSNTDGITRDSTPAFIGTSEPGSLVRIYVGADPANRRLIASAVTDASGAW